MSSRSFTVLIIDDDDNLRQILARQLATFGAKCTSESGGLKALETFKTGHFDLIMLDIHMPDMDGFEVAKQLRDLELSLDRKRTPIIAITADVCIEPARSQSAGIDDLMRKPALIADLKRACDRWLDRSS